MEKKSKVCYYMLVCGGVAGLGRGGRNEEGSKKIHAQERRITEIQEEDKQKAY